jgi:hypothetical protein
VWRFLLALATTLVSILGTCPASRADLPTFQSQLNFGVSCPVWDLTGNLIIPVDVPGLGSGTVSLSLTTDDKGRIQGTGSIAASGFDPFGVLGFIVLDGFDADVRGKIKSSGTGARISLKSTLSGSATGSGFVLPATAKLKFKGEVHPGGIARGIGNLKIKVIKSVQTSGPFDFSIAPDVANDGSWDLDLDITSPDGQALQAIGDVQLSTGRTVSNLLGEGKYNVGDDSAKLGIKGIGGASVKIKSLLADGGAQTITGGLMKYKLLGQKRALILGPGVCP